MATILTDNFNSYSDGDLNGQGSWSGDTDFDVQGATVKEGAKAIAGVDTTSARVQVVKSGTARADGKITIYMRRTINNTGNAYFNVREADRADNLTIALRSNGEIGYRNGAWVTIQNYNVDQWYGIEIEWEINHLGGGPKARYRVNGGAWTDWDTPEANWTVGLNKVFLATNQGSGTSYFDYIAEEPLSVDYNLAVTVGVFTLTGIVAILIKGYTLVASVGNFVLTGIATTFTKALSMAVSVGTFTLTGVAATLSKAKTMIASVATFILTGIAATFTLDVLWKNRSKSTAISPTNLTKIDISPTNLTKNDISPVNLSKNDISPTNLTKNDSTFTNQSKT